MAGNKIYANARAKSAENKLLGTDRFNRMLQAESADDALKILRETNFGEGETVDSAMDFERLVAVERDKLNRFIKEVSPSKAFVRFFLAKNDYHNAEAFIKAKHLRISPDKLLTTSGYFDITVMKEKIMTDDYGELPKPMAEALLTCDNLFVNGTATGGLIDGIIKRALYADMKVLSAKNNDLNAVYSIMADTANISCALRTRNVQDCSKMTVPGGKLTDQELRILCEEPIETLKERLKFFYLSDFISSAVNAMTERKPLSSFEKLSDDALLWHFKKKRYKISGLNPFMLYCYYQAAELTNIRIVMIGLINKLEKTEIQERLRDSYEG